VGEILEREEGLFTRHGATRALCIVSVISSIGFAIVPAVMLAGLTGRMEIVRFLLGWPLLPAIALWFFNWGVSTALYWWRTCDRCSGRLFEGQRVVTHKGFSTEKPHDYRARTFLGSYGSAAILNMAFNGRLRCQWCGHEDGVRPDYVVTSPR
jgi:hypothetical protein